MAEIFTSWQTGQGWNRPKCTAKFLFFGGLVGPAKHRPHWCGAKLGDTLFRVTHRPFRINST